MGQGETSFSMEDNYSTQVSLGIWTWTEISNEQFKVYDRSLVGMLTMESNLGCKLSEGNNSV